MSLAILVAVSVAPPGVASAQRWPADLVGPWKDSPQNGVQETLTLYDNGAYKSVTAIVDPAAFNAHWRDTVVRGCSNRRAQRRKYCTSKGIDTQVETIAKMYPGTMIGTYAAKAARIEFTHGCVENVDNCSAGSVTDSGVFFLEGNTLTIKMDGVPFRGKVIGGATTVYAR